jgi:hypothetical protein
VEPITGVPKGTALINSKTIDPALVRTADGEDRPFDDTDRLPGFGAPTSYLEPISVRLGIKSTF